MACSPSIFTKALKGAVELQTHTPIWKTTLVSYTWRVFRLTGTMPQALTIQTNRKWLMTRAQKTAQGQLSQWVRCNGFTGFHSMKASLLINGEIQLFMTNIAALCFIGKRKFFLVLHSSNQRCHGNLTPVPSCILSLWYSHCPVDSANCYKQRFLLSFVFVAIVVNVGGHY